MDLKFTKSTDTKHKVTLESAIVYAQWGQAYAPVGQKIAFEVGTTFVGQSAPIEVKGKSQKGKNLGKATGKVRGNKFGGELTVPADTKIGDMVYFEVKLPKNGLQAQSNRVAAVPPIKVTNLQWSATEARRGDVVTLSAKVEDAPEAAETKLIIYESDADGAHDKIVELPTKIKNNKIELDWEYEYHEDTDEIPTQAEMQRYGRNYNPPEYFFTVKIDKQEFGKQNRDSGLLAFRDWIEIVLTGGDGNPIADEDYILKLPDGQERKGKLNSNGLAREENLPPGKITISLPGVDDFELESEL